MTPRRPPHIAPTAVRTAQKLPAPRSNLVAERAAQGLGPVATDDAALERISRMLGEVLRHGVPAA